MKTFVLIAFVLLMQQVIDAKYLNHSPESTGSSEEIIPRNQEPVQTSAPKEIIVEQKDSIPVSIILDNLRPSLKLKQPNPAELSTRPCPKKCSGKYDPICAYKNGQIVLFTNKCILDQVNCRNPLWQVLPLGLCGLNFNSVETWSRESWEG